MRLRELGHSYFVTFNSKLNPKVWGSTDLLPEVQDKLIKIAKKFQEFIGVDLPVVDYTVTGSNANYTWTRFSDLDLHIIVKGTVTPEQRELFSAKKALWSEHHQITIKGIPVECYVQGQEEAHHSSGVYSVAHSKWLIEPKKQKPQADDAAVERKLDAIVHDTNAAIASGNLEKIEAMKDRITNMRKAGLERAGEYSTENLVFKSLRNLGVIDKLAEKIRELEDRELSLESKNLT